MLLHDEKNMKMGAMILSTELGHGQIAKGPTEGVTLAETLHHILEILPFCIWELPTVRSHMHRQGTRAIGKHAEENVIELVLQVHTLDDSHLTDGDALRAMTAGHSQIERTTVLHVVQSDMSEAFIRIPDQLRRYPHETSL